MQERVLELLFWQALAASKNFGVQNIMITGGEPLLHPRLSEMLFISKSCGLTVKLASNATFLGNDFFETSFYMIDEIVISFDATTARVYEQIRGVDLFKVLQNNVSLLLNKKKPEQLLKLSFLLQRKNYHQLNDFIDIALNLGVNTVTILVPNAFGDFQRKQDLQQYYKTVFLSNKDKECFLNKIFPKFEQQFVAHTKLFAFGNSHMHAIRSYMLNDGYLDIQRQRICSLPLNSLFICHDGSYKLCPYFSALYKEFDRGLISRERLKLIFNKPEPCCNCLEVPII